MSLRLGIVGTGRMALTMAASLRQAPGLTAVAVCSSDPERARRFAARARLERAHDGLEAMLDDPQLDAVYIANATAAHAGTAIRALEAGKAVLCEKPFAISAEEGDRVLDTAQSTGRPFMEAMWTPYLPAVKRLLEDASNEARGRPRHFSAAFGYPADPAVNPRLFAGPGAGALLDRGIYDVALALRILGPAADVDAMIEFGTDGIDLQASLQIAHEGGGQSQIACSLTALMANAAVVGCERGALTLPRPSVPAEVYLSEGATPAGPGDPLDRASLKIRLLDPLRRAPALRRLKRGLGGLRARHLGYGADPYLPMLARFAALAQGGGVEASLSPLEVIDTARAAGARRARGEGAP